MTKLEEALEKLKQAEGGEALLVHFMATQVDPPDNQIHALGIGPLSEHEGIVQCSACLALVFSPSTDPAAQWDMHREWHLLQRLVIYLVQVLAEQTHSGLEDLLGRLSEYFRSIANYQKGKKGT